MCVRTDDKLAHVAPLQVGGGLVQDGDADAALDALVQQEQPAARQLVAVLHHLPTCSLITTSRCATFTRICSVWYRHDS